MVLGRRRRSLVGAAAASVAVLFAVTLVTLSRPDGPSRPVVPQADGPGEQPPPSATATPAVPAPAPDGAPKAGASAVVTVAVANVWAEPDVGRPLDEPSLGNPVDVRRWVAAMTNDDKLWLVGRLVTQALYGERVVVQEVRGAWARVVVTGQPSSLDPDGYPGWMPSVQLRAGEPAAAATSAVVVKRAATLRDSAGALFELSYNTRLPVLDVGGAAVTVALPTGGRGVLAAADVDVRPPGPRPATGAELVRSAQLFSGLPYLWGGTSGAGYDCSGLTAAVYGAQGIVIARDADDQAAAGTAVDLSRLQPGDLLFYSPNGERRSITHVSMYVGNGMMIQAPATGKTVETVPVDTPQYARMYWGARRYLPAGAA
jgi:cell wall-associated NlpC family hydrolase